jgi:mono/diheme cytochrome c family protein
MNMLRLCASISALLVAVLLAESLRAQADDVFAFIPMGGKTLLMEAVQGAPAEEVQALLTGKRIREEWVSYLQGRKDAVTGLKPLSEHELLTLADYLAYNMPLPASEAPADPGKANWKKLLPPDGRDLAMENCQFCHIITVAVTQAKSQDAWLGTLNKPSHTEIELSPKQRAALASYLVLNGGIPEDLVPEELRAGGASY